MKTYISSNRYSHEEARCFEHCKGESMTVANDSYTVQELFDRYAKGLLVNIERESFYEDTQDFDAIDFQALKHADPYDKQELLLDVQAKAKKAYDALDKWKKEQEAQKGSDSSSSNEDSPKSSKPKNQSKSDKRGGEASDKERSDAERANSPSENT